MPAVGSGRRVTLALCMMLCLAAPVCAAEAVDDLDLGFLVFRGTDLHGHRCERWLGPLFEYRATEAGDTFRAVRPLGCRLVDPPARRELREWLWPLGMWKVFRGETDWRFLNAFGHDFDHAKADSRYRYTLFPVVFGGRDKQLSRYFAVFPLGGTIHEFLGRDRILFVLFPLYARSSIKDTVTHDVLWPLVSWTHGGDVERFRVFPFYGRSVNEGRWVKHFVLWPVWTSVRYEYPGSEGGGFILFPLLGRVDVPEQQTWMVLPPLFRWTSGKDRDVVHCPWPFFQYSSGDVNKLYLWPLWGRKSFRRGSDTAGASPDGDGPGSDSKAEIRSSFFLWPLCSTFRARRGGGVLERFAVVPVWFSETVTAVREEPEGGETEDVRRRYVKIWPLASYRREQDESRFRMLALWPLKQTGGIERNYAPLWTLYSHVRVDGAAEDELLWGLFRRRRERDGDWSWSVFPFVKTSGSSRAERTQWSVLGGLLGYRRQGLRKTYRLLYFLDVTTGTSRPERESER